MINYLLQELQLGLDSKAKIVQNKNVTSPFNSSLFTKEHNKDKTKNLFNEENR